MVEWILYCCCAETMIASLEYLWMIFFVMIVSGIAKEHNLFMPMYSYIKQTFKSNRLVLFLTSALGGVLPIEGRVTISAGILDTLTRCGCSRKKIGVVDYLSTHHYYLWSPLEKTVVLPMAAFGMSYIAWLGLIWPLLLVTAAFILYYVFYRVKEEDIHIDLVPFKTSAVIRNVFPFFAAIGIYVYAGGNKHIFPIFCTLALYYMFLTQTWSIQKLKTYVNWKLLVLTAVVIVAGTFCREYSSLIQNYLQINTQEILVASLLSFLASFAMGSSGKFVALAIFTSAIFGRYAFLWFFTIDYVGYLLSPAHKCVMIGNRYFGTPLWDYYKVLLIWCTLMLLTVGIYTFAP